MRGLLLAFTAAGSLFISHVLPFDSGGTMRHKPPQRVEYKKQTELLFELRIVGEPGEGAGKRYKNERVYFRTRPDEEFRPAKCVRDKPDPKSVLVRATIPPFQKSDGKTLEYYMTVQLDGFSNSIGSPSAPKLVRVEE